MQSDSKERILSLPRLRINLSQVLTGRHLLLLSHLGLGYSSSLEVKPELSWVVAKSFVLTDAVIWTSSNQKRCHSWVTILLNSQVSIAYPTKVIQIRLGSWRAFSNFVSISWYSSIYKCILKKISKEPIYLQTKTCNFNFVVMQTCCSLQRKYVKNWLWRE